MDSVKNETFTINKIQNDTINISNSVAYCITLCFFQGKPFETVVENQVQKEDFAGSLLLPHNGFIWP